MAANVSVIIASHNDEKTISEPIASAKLLTNKIIVLDIASTDRTAREAAKHGAEVLKMPSTPYVEPTREPSIKHAQTDWVFILDADERITPELAVEIKQAIKSTSRTHFKVPRKNIFGRKKWLKNGGWWPDYQIRLINKRFFKSWSKKIHSTPEIEGIMGYLHKPLLHYFHGDFESMVNKTIVFEGLESDLLLKAGRDVSGTSTFIRKFLGELYRRMFKRFGFLDGSVGIIESFYQAFSKTITWIFLYEKRKKSSAL